MLSKLGNYYLDQLVKEAKELKEFNFIEYSIHYASGSVKLKGEKIYHGEEVFKGWKTTIGVVNGKVYKICVDIVLENSKELDDLFSKIMSWLKNEMGNPIENTNPLWMWKAAEGNVVLQKSKNYLGVFLTSRSIRYQSK